MGTAVTMTRGTRVGGTAGRTGTGRRARSRLVATEPPGGQLRQQKRTEALSFVVAGGVI